MIGGIDTPSKYVGHVVFAWGCADTPVSFFDDDWDRDVLYGSLQDFRILVANKQYIVLGKLDP